MPSTQPMRLTQQTLAILNAMLAEPRTPRYGLELMHMTGLKSGTLYPALARLERAEWLESTLENIDPSVAGRPARREYRLTPYGASAARDFLHNREPARERDPREVPRRPRSALA